MTHLPIQRSPVKLIYKLKTCLLIYLFLSTKKAPKITNLKTYVWKKPQTVHCNGNFRLWHITIKTFAFIFTERATFNFFSNSLKVSRIPAVLTQVFTHLAHQNSSNNNLAVAVAAPVRPGIFIRLMSLLLLACVLRRVHQLVLIRFPVDGELGVLEHRLEPWILQQVLRHRLCVKKLLFL